MIMAYQFEWEYRSLSVRSLFGSTGSIALLHLSYL